MDKNFYIMFASNPEWAGPALVKVNEPEQRTNRGRVVDDLVGQFIYELVVDNRVDDPLLYPPLDIHETARAKLFSPKLINLLDELKVDNIQFFDADVTYAPTDEKVKYKVANIIGTISALDMNSSDIVLSPFGGVGAINKMVLDESKMKGHKIFRLKESILHIVVHKSIKEAIEKAGMKGFMFVSDDEFKRGML